MRDFKETFPRLLIMYEHFAAGKLYGDYSWYSQFFTNTGEPVLVINSKKYYFDTYSFLIGEMTYLFSEWQQWPDGIISYKPKPMFDEHQALKHFLGLNRKEAAHLFIPNLQSVDLGGEKLGVDATPQQVAMNIEIFLKMQLERYRQKIDTNHKRVNKKEQK